MKIKNFKLGATNKFPAGKLDDSDEGEVRFAIAADPHNGVVRLEFGKPVAWLGLYPNTAEELGKALIEKADKVRKGIS